MWSTEYSRETGTSPERLWPLLADVDGWGAWNAGIAAIHLDAPLAVGATFLMTPPGEDQVTSTVVELDEGRLLTDETRLGDVVVRVAHVLDPRPGGGTVIRYAISVDGGRGPDEDAEIGTAVSADFPDVIAALAATAAR